LLEIGRRARKAKREQLEPFRRVQRFFLRDPLGRLVNTLSRKG
jgi:hypothetical protein